MRWNPTRARPHRPLHLLLRKPGEGEDSPGRTDEDEDDQEDDDLLFVPIPVKTSTAF